MLLARPVKKFSALLFVLFSAALFPSVVLSDMINITPTRIYLSANNMVIPVKLTNANDKSIIVHLHARRWFQSKNRDQYASTKDVLTFPTIFHMWPHATQLIRVALRKKPDVHVEGAYRLFVDEVIPQENTSPIAKYEKRTGSLKMALHMSVPIFVSPLLPTHSSWQWKEIRVPAHNHLRRLTLTNTGNDMLFINRLLLLGKDNKPLNVNAKVFTYVLPHQSRSWVLRVRSNGPAYWVSATINSKSTKDRVHGMS